VTEPAPTPRLDRTPAEPGHPPRRAGADGEAVLADWGFSDGEIERLKSDGVIGRQ
jgi:alpha-methylacyl-CoA racemase